MKLTRKTISTAAMAAVILATATCPAEQPALSDSPGDALSLQVRFDEQFTPAAGPAPTESTPEAFAFAVDGERAYVSLQPSEERKGPAAVWPAAPVVNTAQGAVSFWFRVPEGAGGGSILSLGNTSSGGWSLRVTESKYRAPRKKSEGETQIKKGAPELSLSLDGEESFQRDLEEMAPPAEEKPQPVSTLYFEAGVRLFAEGHGGRVRAWRNTFEKGEWHHVTWTWRSLKHAVYVDGRYAGGTTMISRIQPPTSADAVVRLLTGNVQIADLRIHNRALEGEQLVALADADPKQYLPQMPPLRVWADWGMLTGRTVVYADTAGVPDAAAVEVRCLNADGEELNADKLTRFPDALGEQAVMGAAPEHFPDGVYHFEAVARDASGKQLAAARSADWKSNIPPHIREWIGTKVGLSTEPTILPPYKPIERDGETLATLMRTHTLERTGMFSQVTAAGGELLDGPVRLEVQTSDGTLAFDDGDGLGEIDNRGHDAEWSAETQTADGHTLTVRGHMTYDGIARFDVTLTPNGALAIEKAELIVPYRDEVVRTVHPLASNYIQHFADVVRQDDGTYKAVKTSWGPIREKHADGVVLDAYDLKDYKGGPMRFRYTPFVHVGNIHRGLSWFVDNDRGWVHNPWKVPPMEMVATDEAKFLRLNVVAKPVELTRPLSFRFYLLANPFKPIPDDWRTWSVANLASGDNVVRNSSHKYWYHWNEYAGGFRPYPGGSELSGTYEDWIGKFVDSPLLHCPFVNFGWPGGSGLGTFPDMQVLPQHDHKTHNSRPHQDYMFYWFDKTAREIGIDGVYVDEPYSDPYSYNLLAGDMAYVRPDGTRGLGYRWMESRAYFERLKRTFLENDRPEPLWMHTTNYKAAPVLTFTDVSMDGEHPQFYVPSFENYERFYEPQKSRAYLSGLAWGFVGTQMYHGNTGPGDLIGVYNKSRSYLAVTLPWRVLPQSTGVPDELHRVNNAQYAWGIFDDGIEELELFSADEWLPAPEPLPPYVQMSGLLNAERNRAMLYVNYRYGPGRYVFPGDLQGLDLGKQYNHAWDAETGVSMNVAGRMTLDTRPRNFTAIWVQGADEPQAPRPDGAILGLSFDDGYKPDFGGGIVPAELQRGDKAPPSVEGRAGKAMSISSVDPSITYPVAPSWIGGTAEFDLKADSVGARPIRILRLQHWLDLTLSLVSRGGAEGLLVQTVELDGDPRMKPKYLDREEFIAVPSLNRGRWNRVALVWQSGNYEIYVNGELAGSLYVPADLKLQDKAFPADGVILGPDGTRSDGRYAIDSLIVYDWPFRPADAAGWTDREPFAAATRPEGGKDFPVWVFGSKSEDFTFAINMGAHPAAARADRAAFTLYDDANPKKPIGKAGAKLLFGAGVADIQPLAAGAEPEKEISLDSMGTDDLLDEMDLEGRRMTLHVDVYAGKNKVASRKVKLETGLEDPTGKH